MTGTPPQKQSLWAMIFENVDFSKILPLVLAMGGVIWYVITQLNQNNLTQYQVGQLNLRMDKVEQNQNSQNITLATIQEDIRNLRPKDK